MTKRVAMPPGIRVKAVDVKLPEARYESAN